MRKVYTIIKALFLTLATLCLVVLTIKLNSLLEEKAKESREQTKLIKYEQESYKQTFLEMRWRYDDSDF